MAFEKILSVDDDQDILGLIAVCLKAEGMIVTQTRKGLETLSLLSQDNYDLLILDLMLKDSDGFEILKKVRTEYPDLPVIILSARKETYNKVLGLGLGADDYVTKPFYREELAARVKALIRRSQKKIKQNEKEGNIISRGDLTLDLKSLKFYKKDKEIELSARNMRLIRFFMENPDQVFSKKQIYEQVWDDPYCDENTVTVYIRKLRQKIEDTPEYPRYIRTIWGMGYKFTSG